eukprot:1338892-Rhodomonas_salina.1
MVSGGVGGARSASRSASRSGARPGKEGAKEGQVDPREALLLVSGGVDGTVRVTSSSAVRLCFVVSGRCYREARCCPTVPSLAFALSETRCCPTLVCLVSAPSLLREPTLASAACLRARHVPDVQSKHTNKTHQVWT